MKDYNLILYSVYYFWLVCLLFTVLLYFNMNTRYVNLQSSAVKMIQSKEWAYQEML